MTKCLSCLLGVSYPGGPKYTKDSMLRPLWTQSEVQSDRNSSVAGPASRHPADSYRDLAAVSPSHTSRMGCRPSSWARTVARSSKARPAPVRREVPPTNSRATTASSSMSSPLARTATSMTDRALFGCSATCPVGLPEPSSYTNEASSSAVATRNSPSAGQCGGYPSFRRVSAKIAPRIGTSPRRR